jgi:hypothetical protein
LKNPTVSFPPAMYDSSAFVMSYPNNYPHGVREGVNPNPARRNPETLKEFLSPAPGSFLKDLVIITFSE